MNFAEVNGVKLHYLREGKEGNSGELMLFLHGFPEYCGIWQEQIDAFKDHYTCVAPDLRGFNLSDQPSDPALYKAKVITEDIRQLIDYLGFKTCILVAHDWGGASAWGFAMKHPEMIDKLIMLNSPHHVPFSRELATNEAQQKASDYMLWLRAEGAEELLKANNYKKMFNFFTHSTVVMSDNRRDALLTSYKRGLGGLNYYRASPLMPRTARPLNSKDFYVSAKTLVIWGMKDGALLPELLDGLEECISDVTIKRLPNATHWLLHEEGAEITRLIKEFIGVGDEGLQP